MEMDNPKLSIFREISQKCVEALNEYFDTCCNEIEDRDNLNDTIMKIGAEYNISLFDRIWFNRHNEAKKNSVELIFAVALPITSTEAAYNDSNWIDVAILRNNKFIGGLVISEEGVSFEVNYDKNGVPLITEEEILKVLS